MTSGLPPGPTATSGMDALTLRELGADSDLVPTLTEDALSDLMILSTPRSPDRAEVEALYLAAM